MRISIGCNVSCYKLLVTLYFFRSDLSCKFASEMKIKIAR